MSIGRSHQRGPDALAGFAHLQGPLPGNERNRRGDREGEQTETTSYVKAATTRQVLNSLPTTEGSSPTGGRPAQATEGKETRDVVHG
jgi:hypothetical protein